MKRRALAAAAVVFALAAVLAYLRDPPWVGGMTSGLRPWSRDADGTAFRWTNGHATFYVPSDASVVTLPVRPGIPRSDGRPVSVAVSIDDRPIVMKILGEPDRWVRLVVSVPGTTTRRFRRVDVRVGQVVLDWNRGVQLGEPELQRRSAGR